ncbi:Uncharacterised protein [uncultured archaeon]|nr:Uncharacterised protein [uncultured archaeon]
MVYVFIFKYDGFSKEAVLPLKAGKRKRPPSSPMSMGVDNLRPLRRLLPVFWKQVVRVVSIVLLLIHAIWVFVPIVVFHFISPLFSLYRFLKQVIQTSEPQRHLKKLQTQHRLGEKVLFPRHRAYTRKVGTVRQVAAPLTVRTIVAFMAACRVVAGVNIVRYLSNL